MKIRLPVLGYFLLGVILFYLFLSWQFPYDQMKKAIKQNFEESLPLTLIIGRVGPSFPFGLRVENIRVSSDSLSFGIPDLVFNLRLLSLLTGETHLNFGDAKNSSRLQGKFSREKLRNRFDLRLNQVEVNASSSQEFSFSLKVSGEAFFQWEEKYWEKGNGQGWALLERGEIKGAQISRAPLLLALFETLRAEIHLRDEVIRLRRLEASGKDTRFSPPQDLQFPLKGGIPLDLGMILQTPRPIPR